MNRWTKVNALGVLGLPLRIEERIEPCPESGCWIFTGNSDQNGYGMTCLNGKMGRAHRLIYEFLVGPIPPGLTLDHLCRVRRCVNPRHVEPVTLRENILRG